MSKRKPRRQVTLHPRVQWQIAGMSDWAKAALLEAIEKIANDPEVGTPIGDDPKIRGLIISEKDLREDGD